MIHHKHAESRDHPKAGVRFAPDVKSATHSIAVVDIGNDKYKIDLGIVSCGHHFRVQCPVPFGVPKKCEIVRPNTGEPCVCEISDVKVVDVEGNESQITFCLKTDENCSLINQKILIQEVTGKEEKVVRVFGKCMPKDAGTPALLDGIVRCNRKN
ncbi:hypothetical protein ACOME3_002297 [Neoechinorhynchus agilis]